jgi:hypothetical protein
MIRDGGSLGFPAEPDIHSHLGGGRMSCKPPQVFLLLTSLAGLPSCVSATEPLQASVYDIQAEPGTFDGKEVVVRGQVYAGVDATNISDPRCPGDAVQLTLSERISEHRDIRSFERGLRIHGMRAVATVTGRSQAKAPTHPFPMPAIDVYAVQGVAFEAK